MKDSHQKITEQSSEYDGLEGMDSLELLSNMNREDQKVAVAVARVLPQVAKVVDAAAERFEKGGRLFYIGAGTRGRLGMLDASEMPTPFGMPHDRVIGLIAGGDGGRRRAVGFDEGGRNE